MLRRALVVSAVVLVLAGCQKSERAAGEEAAVSTDMLEAPAADAAATPGGAPASSAPAVLQPLLAYEHAYTLELPARRVSAVAKAHETRCVQAGPAQCQVVGSTSRSVGRDQTESELELRAAPAWLARFRGGLEADVESAGGRLVEADTESEDLTRAIVDTEAHLRAKRALRGRLEALLASRPGKLQELLEVERELARVQGEIDSAESQLAVMRTRVATSKLTIRYRSASVLAPDGAWSPVADAAGGFARNMAAAFAALLTVVSFLLPWVLVGAPLAWLARRALIRRKRRGPPATRPPEES
ncbi:MAG TPA: DUF4349 domain-containing protein [Caulobacteraceae bacterium]|nr:DUF4349 domain-containing protein [Caulobacteraceae bacterium]